MMRATLSCMAQSSPRPIDTIPSGSLVLVAGAGGGVGQLVTAKLISRGYSVRAIARSQDAAEALKKSTDSKLEVVRADLRTLNSQDSQAKSIMEGVVAVISCTGTTAFPSKRWDPDGANGPEATDLTAASNLIKLSAKSSVKRFVYVTSAGVERQSSFPWIILNLFGVLKFKRMSEMVLEGGDTPWTIFRPGRLTDGPYTSYDLNTLLKATSGDRRSAKLSLADDQALETSRVVLAEAIVQSLATDPSLVVGKKISIGSVADGKGPGESPELWRKIFESAN